MRGREAGGLRSCLPRERSQTMFIVLGGFQGERAGNDGSWSPGEVVACRGEGVCEERGERKKEKQKE